MVRLEFGTLGMYSWPSLGHPTFDDFVSICDSRAMRHVEVCTSLFLQLLGWKPSEDKLVPYEACCKVLGVELNLTRTPTGVASVCNTALAARNFCYSSSKSWTLGACRNQMPTDSAQGGFNLLPTTCLAGGSAITRTSTEGSRTSILRTPRGSVHSVSS